MKHIYLNLKRFDVPVEFGGLNRISSMETWGDFIVMETQPALAEYDRSAVEFVHFFPETHLLSAIKARIKDSPLFIGCQGVYRIDTAPSGNFGALTTNRPASAMKALGCTHTLIGHCEERQDKFGLLQMAGYEGSEIVNQVLNQEIKTAVNRGLRVLYCIGEKAEELGDWQNILRSQLLIGLDGVPKDNLVIAYEPVWSIGPGKTPADREYIIKVAKLIKETVPNVDVVYGGGLKAENAKMLASIDEINGGLVALTRFQGEIGFYPQEFLEIINLYLSV